MLDNDNSIIFDARFNVRVASALSTVQRYTPSASAQI